MSLVELYPQIRLTHIGLAVTSGSFFAVRGLAVLGGPRWPAARLAKSTSMLIDTALLGAALMLLWVLNLNQFAVPWLLAKLSGLVAYVVLGTWALRKAKTQAARAVFFVAAVACFLWMFSVA